LAIVAYSFLVGTINAALMYSSEKRQEYQQRDHYDHLLPETPVNPARPLDKEMAVFSHYRPSSVIPFNTYEEDPAYRQGEHGTEGKPSFAESVSFHSDSALDESEESTNFGKQVEGEARETLTLDKSGMGGSQRKWHSRYPVVMLSPVDDDDVDKEILENALPFRTPVNFAKT